VAGRPLDGVATIDATEAPVTKWDARGAKNTAAHKFVRLTHRPARVRSRISSCIEGMVFTGAVISVSNHPGSIALTCTFPAANSIAIDVRTRPDASTSTDQDHEPHT
jgi:hypothetical protein